MITKLLKTHISLLIAILALNSISIKAASCVDPTGAASNLFLNPTTSSISGSFTTTADADAYLIIRSSSSTLSASPVDNSSYSSGDALGGGTVISYQSGANFTDNTSLTPGSIYYYFVFAANSVTCTGTPKYNTSSYAIGSTTIPNGSATYTASSTWTCPTGVSSIEVACYAGGGGGGAGGGGFKQGGGGGGGGAYAYNAAVSVTAGNQYTVAVGSGGTGGTSGGNGTDGGNSTFDGTTVVANGGTGGLSHDNGGTKGTGGTGTYNGGDGDNGGSTNSGGGGGGAGSSDNGDDATSYTGGAGGTSGGGAGGNGTNVGTTAGLAGASFGGGGGGGTGGTNGGAGGNGAVSINCPCNSFTPTFAYSADTNTCLEHPVTYATQSGQTNYSWSVSGTEGVDYEILSGGIAESNYTVTLAWLTTGSKTVTVNYTSGACSGSTAASSSTTVVTAPTSVTFTSSPGVSTAVGASVTYTTQTGKSNYTWDIGDLSPSDYTITSGGISSTDNTVTLTWDTPGLRTVTVNYTNGGSCYASESASSSTSVGLPVPTFTTSPSGDICSGTSVTYTTQGGQTNYDWTVPGTLATDYSISSGGIGSSDSTVTLTWLTVGEKTVTVNYEDSGFSGASPASSTVDIITIPEITSVTNGSTCGNGTVDLAAESNYGGTINWYTLSTGGSSVNTGDTYSPFISSDQTYYVDATNTCGTTASRSTVIADKNPPAPTILGTSATSICNAGTATLTAAVDNGIISWYDVASGGTSLITGGTLNTPYLTSTTTYYVEAVNCGGSSARTAVTATVYPNPTLSSSYSPTAICSGSTFNYTATSATSGVTFTWERDAVSGISNTYATATSSTINETLTDTTSSAVVVTYTIDLSANGCSNTEYVNLTVNPAPSISSTFTPSACSDVEFSVTPTNATDGIVPTGTTYTWTAPTVTGGITGAASGTNEDSISGAFTNSSSSAQTATYTVTPTFNSCSGSNFTVQATINATPSVIVSDGNTCPGGTITFDAESTISGSTFEWFLTDTSTIAVGTDTSYVTPVITDTTSFYVEATANGCTSAREELIAFTSADSTEWTGAFDNNWSNSLNWSNGVPCSQTQITIPNVSTPGVNYPIISSPVYCDNIVFEPGSGCLGLENLEYSKAFIRTELARESWYTLTAPLKEMYAGDYSFTGQPVVKMRLFDQVNPDSVALGGTTYTGTWTKTFNSMNVALDPGTGFAYTILAKTYDYPNPINYSDSSDVTVTFPRLNADSSLMTDYYPYSTYNGFVYTTPISVTKDSSLAYRFAAENASNELADVDYTLKAGVNLVGNPLMTHLDFDLLYADNSGVINNKVKFWNGTTFTTYIAGSDLTSAVASSDNTTNIIPPMQAFFVESSSGGTMTVDIDGHFVADNSMQLKGASVMPCLLHIKSNNGKYESSTAIARRDYADNSYEKNDAFKLFSQIEEVPEVYTISDGMALDINQFDALPYTIPLGIRANKTDSVNLQFNGPETFGENVTIELINAKTGEVVDLKEENTYKYATGNNNDEGSLFISFRDASVITDNESIGLDHDIQIYATDKGTIHVTSMPNDTIREVIIFNVSGRIVEQMCVRGKTSLELPISGEDIYLVQVFTENNTRIAKLLVK